MRAAGGVTGSPPRAARGECSEPLNCGQVLARQGPRAAGAGDDRGVRSRRESPPALRAAAAAGQPLEICVCGRNDLPGENRLLIQTIFVPNFVSVSVMVDLVYPVVPDCISPHEFGDARVVLKNH
ncbi:hypothetical protein GUJ93_ZPchr0010g10832 [Zizania palustris]|uniref:Uncharacterized protein n=1 Tax=Zizania palustris TaxID=103762 RepID=A0A8J5W8B8_ZIZPA|nr:hypothetical protein GUJ93_ZPchr0010g10832 [Zizania palustris]